VQIPPAIITPIFYEYNLGYSVATTLKPGMGYWVKASSPEQLVLCTDSTSYNAEAVTRPRISDEEFNSLTVTDRDGRSQSLHFGGANGRPVIGEAVELPPRPPAEAFDVRFGDGTAVWGNEADSREVTVEVQGARYPIEVTWRMKPGGGSYSMVTMSDAGKEVSRNDLTGSGKITLQDARSGSLVLRKGGSGSVQSTVPRTYGLDQNYPNPFNPSTSISYELPVTSYVKVVVVNVLGQEVARLVDGVQSAGLRTVEFDAGSLPSGMYFYRMEASSAAGGRTSFTATRKMLLLK
jgi:hypothetical protein